MKKLKKWKQNFLKNILYHKNALPKFTFRNKNLKNRSDCFLRLNLEIIYNLYTSKSRELYYILLFY